MNCWVSISSVQAWRIQNINNVETLTFSSGLRNRKFGLQLGYFHHSIFRCFLLMYYLSSFEEPMLLHDCMFLRSSRPLSLVYSWTWARCTNGFLYEKTLNPLENCFWHGKKIFCWKQNSGVQIVGVKTSPFIFFYVLKHPYATLELDLGIRSS